MINFNDKELKIINEFKNYIKDSYIDFINHEVIEVYFLGKSIIKMSKVDAFIDNYMGYIGKIEVKKI